MDLTEVPQWRGSWVLREVLQGPTALKSMGSNGAILQNAWSLAPLHLEKLRDAHTAEPCMLATIRGTHQLCVRGPCFSK